VIQRFDTISLDPRLLEGIEDMRFAEMTPVQREAIPLALAGHDIIAAAQTGTGKTAAFLIPLVSQLMAGDGDQTRALVLTPTRELAFQIDEQLTGLAYHCRITSACVVGGLPFGPQEEAIREKVDALIATPGRLLDHMRFEHTDLRGISCVVLDEADRMFDMGFLPDLRRILGALPEDRQTLLFSATINDEVRRLADRYLRAPKEVSIGLQVPVDAVRQRFIEVDGTGKSEVLIGLLRNRRVTSALVFVATKRATQELARRLQRAGLRCDALHGDRPQEERTEALEKFRRGDVDFLVATDVASRGIDVVDVSHVINFDMPRSPDDYVHRVGRTARAEKKGEAITFVSTRDYDALDAIERVLGKRVETERPPQRRRSGRS
jgi:ATP-dependent RNA helicase RhlE